jgi:uncharacterized protein
MNSQFAQFNKKSYLNLETFRKTGASVKTPVWFVQDGNTLYVRTVDGSGKVKRVRKNSAVRVVPCSVSGEPQGEWENAIAALVDGNEAKQVEKLLDRKYGLMGILFGIQGKMKKTVSATIKIEAAQQ